MASMHRIYVVTKWKWNGKQNGLHLAVQVNLICQKIVHQRGGLQTGVQF